MFFNEYQLTGEYTTRDSLILPSSEQRVPMNHITGVPDPVERRAPLPAEAQTSVELTQVVAQTFGNVVMPAEAREAYRQL